ncbi:MAG: non-homologous end-joining DNA ligase [Armatimonadota bacterium]
MRIDDHEVKVSGAGKFLFPREGITKGELIDYYCRVAETMLPHLRGRPVSMLRYPDGIEGKSFYQKQASAYFPEWIHRAAVPMKKGGVKEMVVCDNAATLVYLANLTCITPHVFLSRDDKLNYPDRMIFDLDPPEDGFALVVRGALELRDLLREAGLTPFVMTTGSRGLHVTVPLVRTADFDEVRAFAQGIAAVLVERDPDRYTMEMTISKRGDRLFIDTLRNSYAATAVPPYAVRPRPGAPVATPLDWDELKDRELTPQRYTIQNLFTRLKRTGDPWAEIERHAGQIRTERRKAA